MFRDVVFDVKKEFSAASRAPLKRALRSTEFTILSGASRTKPLFLISFVGPRSLLNFSLSAVSIAFNIEISLNDNSVVADGEENFHVFHLLEDLVDDVGLGLGDRSDVSRANCYGLFRLE